jgi:hypothetical protein
VLVTINSEELNDGFGHKSEVAFTLPASSSGTKRTVFNQNLLLSVHLRVMRSRLMLPLQGAVPWATRSDFTYTPLKIKIAFQRIYITD